MGRSRHSLVVVFCRRDLNGKTIEAQATTIGLTIPNGGKRAKGKLRQETNAGGNSMAWQKQWPKCRPTTGRER